MDAEHTSVDYPESLTYSVAKRRGKLIKYRRMLRIYRTVSVSAGMICALLLMMHAAPVAMAAGGAGLFFVSACSYIEKKYDKIRLLTIKELGRGACVCRCGHACACRESFVRDMDENHDVNLSY